MCHGVCPYAYVRIILCMRARVHAYMYMSKVYIRTCIEEEKMSSIELSVH